MTDQGNFGFEDKPILKKPKLGRSPPIHRLMCKTRRSSSAGGLNSSSFSFNSTRAKVLELESADSTRLLREQIFELRQDMARVEGKLSAVRSPPPMRTNNSRPESGPRNRKRKGGSPPDDAIHHKRSKENTLTRKGGKKRKIQDVVNEEILPEPALRTRLRARRVNFNFISPQNHFFLDSMEWE